MLALVDAVACEDTRAARRCCATSGCDKPLLAVHEHNEREAAATVVERLARGERVAYVSDAGTPAVSDPGAALVAAVQAAGHRCVPLPGASSALAALCVAGDAAADGFVFVGFLPARGRERAARRCGAACSAAATQVLFEAPHRIEALGGASWPQLCRDGAVTRVPRADQAVRNGRDAAGRRRARLAAQPMPNRARGEFVLVLHARHGAAHGDDAGTQSERVLRLLLREHCR